MPVTVGVDVEVPIGAPIQTSAKGHLDCGDRRRGFPGDAEELDVARQGPRWQPGTAKRLAEGRLAIPEPTNPWLGRRRMRLLGTSFTSCPCKSARMTVAASSIHLDGLRRAIFVSAGWHHFLDACPVPRAASKGRCCGPLGVRRMCLSRSCWCAFDLVAPSPATTVWWLWHGHSVANLPAGLQQ